MTQSRREVIRSEIVSLRRSINKCNKDHRIITDMIDDLVDDKIGIERERSDLLSMIIDRDNELKAMTGPYVYIR